MDLFYKIVLFIATPILPIASRIEMNVLPILLGKYSLITSIFICITIVFTPVLLIYFLLRNTLFNNVNSMYLDIILGIIVIYAFIFGYLIYIP